MNLILRHKYNIIVLIRVVENNFGFLILILFYCIFGF